MYCITTLIYCTYIKVAGLLSNLFRGCFVFDSLISLGVYIAVRVKNLGAGGGGDDSSMDELTQTSQAAAELSSFNYFKYKVRQHSLYTCVNSV